MFVNKFLRCTVHIKTITIIEKQLKSIKSYKKIQLNHLNERCRSLQRLSMSSDTAGSFSRSQLQFTRSNEARPKVWVQMLSDL